MKSNTPKLLTLLVLVFLSATGAGVARGGRHRHHPHEGGPAQREIRAYFQANVLPVVRQQRQKLEPQLTAADRAQLATYRTQLQDLKARGKALHRSFRPEAPTPGAPRPEPTEAQRAQLHQLHYEARGIMLQVAQLAHQYEAAITKLTQEVQPQQEKWAADIQAIRAKNPTPTQPETPAAADGHPRKHGHHEHGHLRHFFKPAMFLLMDPNAPATDPAERGLGNTSFYPNPAAATSQLEYATKKAGPVTIDLLDHNGNKLRTLVSEANQNQGNHTQSLDLHDLPAGTYFYQIITRSGTETKRFVKE